jgi:hypothetical protein
MSSGYLRNSYFQPGHDNPFLFVFARTGGVFQFDFGQRAVGDIAFLLFSVAIVLLLRAKRSPRHIGPSPRQLGVFLLLPFLLNAGVAIAHAYPYGGTRHSSFLAIFALAGVSYALARMEKGRSGSGLGAAVAVVVLCQAFGTPHRPYMLRADQSNVNMAHAV